MPTEEVDKSIEIGSELQLLEWEFNGRFNFKIINVAITYMTHCKIQSIDDIKENSQRELKSILENAFKKCFDDSIICWYKCIISVGAYSEGDKINSDE